MRAKYRTGVKYLTAVSMTIVRYTFASSHHTYDYTHTLLTQAVKAKTFSSLSHVKCFCAFIYMLHPAQEFVEGVIYKKKNFKMNYHYYQDLKKFYYIPI